jgi:phosphatidylinositol glycan class B
VSGERFVRLHLAVLLAVTCVTAWFSYGCFHNDEYFQIIELTRLRLGEMDPRLMPWEYGARIRPWLQPFVYWCAAKVVATVGVRDIFQLAIVFRLLTGVANVGALALFLRTTLPWMSTPEEKRAHTRIVTLIGFLPYLFVRTSSESGSMAALTAGFAVLLAGATPRTDGSRQWSVPALARPMSALLGGFSFGLAFEMRFQTAFLGLGVVAWLIVVARVSAVQLLLIALGGVSALMVGAVVDFWGYGVWTFPALSYFRANVLEGVADSYGRDPAFAYLWILPANVFFPVLVALLVLAVMAWIRCPRHPITWATLPFFVVHNLIAHKEERFLFPMAVLATALPMMAIGPSFANPSGRLERSASWCWAKRSAWSAKALAVASFAGMLLLAFVPLNWRLNVRFTRHLHDMIGDELHATALPEVGLYLPAFHPRIYDVDRADPEEIARRLDAGTARRWLITDRPTLDGTPLEHRAELVYSELPLFEDVERRQQLTRLLLAADAKLPGSRKLRFRSLYRLKQ